VTSDQPMLMSAGRACPALGRTRNRGYCSALAGRRQLGVDTSTAGGCLEVSTLKCRRPVVTGPPGRWGICRGAFKCSEELHATMPKKRDGTLELYDDAD